MKEIPKNWYCRPETIEQAKVLAKYFDDNKCGTSKKFPSSFYFDRYITVLSHGLTYNFGFYKSTHATEISFLDFEKYILNKQTDEVVDLTNVKGREVLVSDENDIKKAEKRTLIAIDNKKIYKYYTKQYGFRLCGWRYMWELSEAHSEVHPPKFPIELSHEKLLKIFGELDDDMEKIKFSFYFGNSILSRKNLIVSENNFHNFRESFSQKTIYLLIN